MTIPRLAAAAVTVLLSTIPALAYDDSWYEAIGWSGEYPNGFTMVSDATVRIRQKRDPEAGKWVECLLKKGATYHQWNASRVSADELEFVSLSKIETYEVQKDYAANVMRNDDSSEMAIAFKKGDRWSYLVYGSEGFFVMRFGDVLYTADQDLIENSQSVGPAFEGVSSVDEWLKLKCANGVFGWILMRDVADDPAFGSANIADYGRAEDAVAE